MDLSLRRRDGRLPRLFVLNQFHSWGSTTLHAGNMDNNLTQLQRRVENYCGEATGWRKPNYLAIDFNRWVTHFPMPLRCLKAVFISMKTTGPTVQGTLPA